MIKTKDDYLIVANLSTQKELKKYYQDESIQYSKNELKFFDNTTEVAYKKSLKQTNNSLLEVGDREVLSQSTKKKDRTIKYNILQEEGGKYYISVKPKENFAEVYQLKNSFYKLQGKFTNEKYTFEIDNCKIDFILKIYF